MVVQNLQRSLLFIPAAEVFDDASGEIAALEAVVAAEPERRMELLQLLHSRCTDLKAEIRAVMLKHGVKTMRLVPVKRSYAFEDPSIPAREQWVLKVSYGIKGQGVAWLAAGYIRASCLASQADFSMFKLATSRPLIGFQHPLCNHNCTLHSLHAPCRCGTLLVCLPCLWGSVAPTLWQWLVLRHPCWRACSSSVA